MFKVEFHCHTSYSHDCLVKPSNLVRTARAKGIDRLVVTDHNTIQGAVAARSIDPELIIIGEEIITTRGELLAFFVQENIPENLSPLEAIARLRDQDAFISVSHPYDLQRSGWALPELEKIWPLVDAIEVFNSRCLDARFNHLASLFAAEYNLAGTVGSDAHILWEVGRSTLALPEFNDAAGLRNVIRKGKADVRMSPFWVHLGSSFSRIFKLLFKLNIP